jgi:general secretion pathway protein E
MQKVSNLHALQTLQPIKARGIEQAGRFVGTGGTHENRVVDLLNNVFECAVLKGASDVHLEFDDIEGLVVRLRKAGELSFFAGSLDAEAARVAKTKICAKSKLDDQERLIPQDGRMLVYFGERRVDIRVAITPTVAGFKIVCRLLDSQNANTHIDTLEVPFLVCETMKRVAAAAEGMVLISGPTGSGKTTTLYALLQHLNDESRHIVTIENPVEYGIKSFTQIDVDGHMTFPMAMKSSLRLDPDIIMVGEIRDEESAEIAVKAGTSGHMVLSTVHTNSAAEVVTRLLSFRLQGFEVSTVLSAMIAQRLVKRIDDAAEVEWVTPNDIEREWLIKRGMFSETMRFPKIVKGGFLGRVPMVEMIEVTPQMRLIMEGGGDGTSWVPQIVELATMQEQFETLAQAGINLALTGRSTLQEVMKTTSDVGYIPSRLRFEQILVYQGDLSIEDLEATRIAIHAARQDGKIVTLEQQLVNTNTCSSELVADAIKSSKGMVNR